MATQSKHVIHQGRAQSVLGPIDADNLGVVLTHEHLLAHAPHLTKEPDRVDLAETFHAPITMEVLGRIRFGGAANFENCSLTDLDTAIEEISLFKQAGGDTIVDVTSIGIGRDPAGLARIARDSGVNIIMGCSYYVEDNYPADARIDEKREEEIVEEIARDILEGVDGTDIRAGIIGEVGCSWPLTNKERKVLRASGRAQRLTGAALSIHPGRNPDAPREIVQVLRQVDADLSRTIMCHVDRTLDRKDLLSELAESGCILEYDLFGSETSYYPWSIPVDMPNDGQRLRWLEWLIAEGYRDQIVISQDTYFKHQLARYGGPGYAHIPANVVPLMRTKGFDEETIRTILIDNPARLLAFSNTA
jgi:phosphotriesterase-related protein